MAGRWDEWIGREEHRTDTLDPALAARWLATFDLPTPDDGAMPQGIHLCLCTPDAPTRALGEDGHPLRDDSPDSFLPPVPMPRRMWASSSMEFFAPICIGDAIERTSRILSITEKEGGSGSLVFVNVEHVTSAGGKPAVREVQSLVYREAAAPDAPLQPPPPGSGSFDGIGWDVERSLCPSPALLFRYSALTFNTHRIHYDAPYCEKVERYRGIVVHGPLITSLLLQLAASKHGDNALASFAFRAASPAVAGETLTLAMKGSGDEIEMGSFASDGRQTIKASATLA